MQSGSSFSPHGESKSKYRLRWGCYTVAFLRHQDSILSVGEWYPLELAKNWVKQIATAHVTMTSTPPMASPAAVKRPQYQGAAPNIKVAMKVRQKGEFMLV